MGFDFTNTDWRTAMQGASLEIDDRLGEDLIVTPCVKRPNFDPAPDEANAVQLRGVFSYRAETVFKAANLLPVESRKPIASFSHAALPWALQRSDQVQRCCDGAIFEVTDIKPDGVSRVTCDLVQLGRQAQ